MQYYGEIGGGIGAANYIGQIGDGAKNYTPTYNIFYRKLLANRFGVRINYEYLPLRASDSLSKNPQILSRGFKFYKTFHEVNFLLEYFFKDSYYLNAENHLMPYVGIGMGYMLNVPTDQNNFDYNSSLLQVTINQFWPVCTIPVNMGFIYRTKNNLNIFGEFTYRFTTSDLLDDFSADAPITTSRGVFNAKHSGNDKLYSLKIGISKSLFKVFGPDRNKKKKKGKEKQ